MTITVHNITIDGARAPSGAPRWDAGHYEQVVRRILVHVFNSPVGLAIIPQLRRQLTIVPERTFAQDGAFTGPSDWAGARLRGATVYQCGTPAQTGQPAMGAPLPNQPRSTGVGSDVTISFTPLDWHDPTRRVDGFIPIMPSRRDSWPGSFADEVLCHELVHATRQMRGVMQCVGIRYNYATFEEFCAVQVANVYASHRGRPIASQYVGPDSRDGLLDPFGAQTQQDRDESSWIERMGHEQPDFCYALGSIPVSAAPYNPFRRWRSPYMHYVSQYHPPG